MMGCHSDEIIKCTGCENCGAELDESAGDDVEMGLCPECKREKMREVLVSIRERKHLPRGTFKDIAA